MQRYRVQVPQGVQAGTQFVVNVGGQHMRVTCPAGSGPGSTIEIQAPAPQGQMPPQASYQHQGYAQAPAPVPPQGSLGATHSSLQRMSLTTPQCPASADAERQLAAITTAPPPGLIFTAMDRDGSGAVDVAELQHGLSQGGRMEFSLKTCKLLVNLYDVNKDGKVRRDEFLGLWQYLDSWRACFDAHDKSKTGLVKKDELRAAIQQVGYKFSDEFYNKLVRIYDTASKGGVSFDVFIQVFCELHNLTEAFKKHDHERVGRATFQYEEFLNAAYSIHL